MICEIEENPLSRWRDQRHLLADALPEQSLHRSQPARPDHDEVGAAILRETGDRTRGIDPDVKNRCQIVAEIIGISVRFGSLEFASP